MIGCNLPKRPEKPAALYAQELLVRSRLLEIRLRNSKREDEEPGNVNRCTAVEAKLGTRIYRIYSAYASRMEQRAGKEEKRWAHLRRQLQIAGKNADIRQQKELAEALDMHKNMIGDAQLLHDARRAGIDGVCRVLMGLGHLKAADGGAMPKQPPENLTEAQRAAYMQQLRRDRAQASRKLIETPKRHFAGYLPTQEDAAAIRGIAAPFGYWLPGEEDQREREKRIASFRKAAYALDGKSEPEKAPEEKETEKEKKPEIDKALCEYLWLSRFVTQELCEPQGKWMYNPNKLRMIIACCQPEEGAEGVKRAYHAFGLHPEGLCEGRDGAAMYRTPDFPVDQVVAAAIEAFQPLIASVKKTRLKDRTSAFWGMLDAQLREYDQRTFAKAALNLHKELFYVKGDGFGDMGILDLSNHYAGQMEKAEFTPDDGLREEILREEEE